MNRFSQFLFLIFIMLSSMIYANDVQKAINDLNNLEVKQSAKIENYQFSKDVANFNLIEGQIHILSKVNDRSIAVFFEGQGIVTISPTEKVNQERLKSLYDREQIDVKFQEMFFIISDSTIVDIVKSYEFTDDSSSINSDLDYYLSYVYNETIETYDTNILNMILNPEIEGYFYTQIDDYIIFEYCPWEKEEVAIYGFAEKRHLGDTNKALVTMFDKKEDYFLNNNIDNYSNIADIDNYTINSSISQRLEFTSNCSFELIKVKENYSWINLKIFNKLEVEKILLNNKDIQYFKGEESSDIWIKIPDNFNNNEKNIVSIQYGGKLIKQGGKIVISYSQDFWYPQTITWDRRQFDLTFTYPKKYDLVSVGRKISEEKAKKTKTTRWKTSTPVNFAPFNLGKYRNDVFEHPQLPYISINMNSNLNIAKADVANSAMFYSTVYGNCLYDSLFVAETPYFLSGESYPGLVNFYSDDFLTSPEYRIQFDLDIEKTDFVQLRAHEVAHQWWGCGVKIEDYHDKWIAEGLAEFSSIWFIQTSLNDTKKYFEFLSKWRNKILKEDGFSRKAKKIESPLILGSLSPTHITYYKGGWIFHMLRNMMINLDTYDETKFKNMMKDFYLTYKDKVTSTKDFQNIVEKHMKADMSWFFDQWVYSSEIPKLKYDYAIITKSDGKLYFSCTIEQKNVSDNFKSYIPIEFDFGNNSKARIRKMVEGSSTVFEIALPAKPKKVNFNIFQSVLSY